MAFRMAVLVVIYSDGSMDDPWPASGTLAGAPCFAQSLASLLPTVPMPVNGVACCAGMHST
eukprot:scaffold242703_cov33-Tisochrysis_lutea.AAC.1